jgi:uncharacterized protein
MHRHLVLLITLFSLMLALTVYGGWEEADSAYDRGDYAAAYREFKILAEQGDPRAQLRLATMYKHGEGVPQNYTEAVKWYREVAQLGDELSQAALGVMYFEGKGVPQDLVQAHMWFNLAAAQGLTVAASLRDQAAKRMTPAQITEAQRLAREWKPKSQ